jgi:hypothetical protein
MTTILGISDASANQERATRTKQTIPDGSVRHHREPKPRRGLIDSWVGTGITLAFVLLGSSTAWTDPVIDWNQIMEETVATVDPALRTRSAAITQLAVFDAVNSIIGDYEPYVRRIPAPAGASPEAAAIAAAHRALLALHPDNAVTLGNLRASSLAAIPDGQAKNDGIAIGIAAADAILALRAHDCADKAAPYTLGTKPGEWQPTPPDFVPAYLPGWGQVVTFGIRNGAQFRAEPPPGLNTSKYARCYNEVKELGDVNSTARPPDRTNVARFYGVTEPIPIYNPAARQVSKTQGKTLSQNARIFALLAMAISDAAISVFETKYFYNYWRPVTAIRAGDTDNNRKTDPDPNWLPLIPTPPFPSYPSGHASFGGGARAVLERLFGEDGHSITLVNPAIPDVVLRYTSWEQITDDIDDARIYGGVHYRFDQEAAARQGRRIGLYILAHRLRPVREHDFTVQE